MPRGSTCLSRFRRIRKPVAKASPDVFTEIAETMVENSASGGKPPVKNPPKSPIHPKGEVAPSPLLPLSALQLRFVDGYVALKNKTKAAIHAGYAKRSAGMQGARLMKNARIVAEINARLSTKRLDALEVEKVTEVRVLQELTAIGLANMQDYMLPGNQFVDVSKLPRHIAAAISEVTVESFNDGRSDLRPIRRVKFKLVPKNPALEMLGRYFGMLDDGRQPPSDPAMQVMARILEKIDSDQRASRAKTIDHQSGGGNV